MKSQTLREAEGVVDAHGQRVVGELPGNDDKEDGDDDDDDDGESGGDGDDEGMRVMMGMMKVLMVRATMRGS